MANHYCNPEWHDGQRVEADYLVQGLERVPFHGRIWWQMTSGVSGRAERFLVCRVHVEVALHIVLRNCDSVRVVETERAKPPELTVA